MLLHYQLLPTDERFLKLRPWECAWLFWLNHFRGKLAAAQARSPDQPVKLESVLADEGAMTDEEFEAKVAELDAIDEARERGLPIPVRTPEPAKVEEEVASFSLTPPWQMPGSRI